MDTLERAKKIVDLLAGIAVVATLIFVALQWREMREGGKDTSALANAAKAQAEAAKSLAESAKSQADNTARLAKAAVEQVEKLDAGVRETHSLASATKRSADAAKSTAETTAGQLEMSQRPWIKIVDVKTTGESPIIPALSFQQFQNGEGGLGHQATFQLNVLIKNIGHSVADVAIRFELFFPLWDQNRHWDVIRSEERRFCDSAAGSASQESPDFFPKFVVFPDETFTWNGAAAALVTPKVTNHLPDKGDAGYVLPVLMVCANYRLRTLPNSYQTRTIYEAFRVEDRTRFFKVDEGVPASKILLIRNEMADDTR